MAAIPARVEREPIGTHAHIEWQQIAAHAPQMTATMSRYLRQAATFLAPLSIEVADNTLRQLSRFLLSNTTVAAVGDVRADLHRIGRGLADVALDQSDGRGHQSSARSTRKRRITRPSRGPASAPDSSTSSCVNGAPV